MANSAQKPFIIGLSLALILLAALPAGASQVFDTRVKVIHGSKGQPETDPRISEIVKEIQPVFQYNRFKMLKQKDFSLHQGEQGRIPLPGQRDLVVMPEKVQGDRIKYQIRINSGGSQVFRTGVMLRKGHSVTIGGPRHKNGVLLFNIHGNTR